MSQNIIGTGPDDALIQRIEKLEQTIQQMQAAAAVATQNMTGLTLTEGTITATAINGSTITGTDIVGGTITGGLVRTAATGQRVVLNQSTNEIEFYDVSGNLVGALYANPVTMLLASSNTGTPKFSLSGTTSWGGGANSGIQIGAQTVGLQIVSSGYAEFVNCSLTVDGDITATGNVYGASKFFDIPHPDGTPDKRLQYVSTESPEALLMCRGKGSVPPALPQHFLDVTEPNSIEYVIGDNGKGCKNWIATGIRKGYAGFNPEYSTPKELPQAVEKTQSQSIL